jgi:SanA protein
LSGDNHLREYNEPAAMKSALMAEGVPESAMTLDYAGLRTLDSVVRAREVFGQSKLTIITDEFHAYRAVFLSKKHGIDAVAYCSEDIPFESSTKARMREYGARIKAMIDLYVLDAQPKFLGEKIEIKL